MAAALTHGDRLRESGGALWRPRQTIRAITSAKMVMPSDLCRVSSRPCVGAASGMLYITQATASVAKISAAVTQRSAWAAPL